MRLVIALGGNALLRREEALSAETQRKNAQVVARQLASVVGRGSQVVLTHGNGSQVGFLAAQTAAAGESAAWPLDILVAESAGMIGYTLEQALREALPAQEIATLLTQVEISAQDAAFSQPSKPIGINYTQEEAEAWKASKGWSFVEEKKGFRRVVPSPRPKQVLGVETISRMVDAGVLVICGGGGGIPVLREEGGGWQGVEAVIDKDLVSSHLAIQLKADALVILTDVDAVYADYGTPQARRLAKIELDDIDLTHFPAGSMRPKIQAVMEFVQAGGRFAAIGALEELEAILAGDAGTWFVASSPW